MDPLDSFEVLDPAAVGSGRFGTVFRARVVNHNGPDTGGTAGRGIAVALKKISLSSGHSIESEMEALHSVKGHENVVELLAGFAHVEESINPSAYLVFPLFPAKAFSSILSLFC